MNLNFKKKNSQEIYQKLNMKMKFLLTLTKTNVMMYYQQG